MHREYIDDIDDLETLDIPTARVFLPLLNSSVRYKGAAGGRGGAKSHFFGENAVREALLYAPLRTVFLREVQRTLEHSSKALVESKLAKFGLGEADGFTVYNDCIETPRDGLFIFNGLQNHTAESIKSLEAFDRAVIDEGQTISGRSLELLRPTIRAAGSQIWAGWNPKTPPNKDDPMSSIDGMFRLNLREQIAPSAWNCNLPDGGVFVWCGWQDNPWLPKELKAERDYDLENRSPEDYAHIWEGAYQTKSGATVFTNWKVAEFQAPPGAIFRHGADFGFAQDPSAGVRCFIGDWNGPGTAITPNEVTGKDLFIEYEVWRVGCDIDYTPALFAGSCPYHPTDARRWKNPYGDPGLPDVLRWPIIADSARPETISHCVNRGLRMVAARKGAGSVEEGIEFLRSYRIWIHPRCRNAANEFTSYSYRVDPRTGLVLPVLVDANNHIIDATRYAIEPVRRPRGFFG